MRAIHVVFLLFLFMKIICSDGNTGIFDLPSLKVIPYKTGGARVIFTNVSLEDNSHVNTPRGDLKCVIQANDDHNTIEVDPEIVDSEGKVICRLPPQIASGRVKVNLEVENNKTVSYRHASQQVKSGLNIIINPSPEHGLRVDEEWERKEITLSWNPEYFSQFYPDNTSIFLELNIFISQNGTSEFILSDVKQAVGYNNNEGTINVTISNETFQHISEFRYPYFYVIRPAGSDPGRNISQSSRLFTPTLGISENIAKNICSIWLVNATAPLLEQVSPCPNCLCKAKLDQNFIEAEYDPQIVKMSNGRLANHTLFYQRVPMKNGSAQSCSYNIQTEALATSSPVQAAWIHSVSRDISYLENYLSDIWPYIVCCLQTNSLEQCQAFHERRPVDTGHNYTGADQPCQGSGDPHMVTFEDVYYDFMGFGEFWLIKGTNDTNFGVQGRMAPGSPTGRVTYYKAIAIKEGNITIQIQSDHFGAVQVILNKETFLDLPSTPMTIPLDGASISFNGSFIDVRVQTGFTIKVLHHYPYSYHPTYFDVYGHGAQRNKGKGYMGLFGNFDGNRTNDLTSRGGFVLPPTSQNLYNLSLIHNTFGMTWLTTPGESYFVYEEGLDWNYYVDQNFGPILDYPNPADMPEEVKAICKDNLACYYEYVGTGGDLEMAAGTAKAHDDIQKLQEEVAKEVPMCEPLGFPGNGTVTVGGFLNGSIATYSCGEEYDLVGNSSRTCVDIQGNLVWDGVQPTCIWTCEKCVKDMEYKLSHDPNDCSKFFACTNGKRHFLQCPEGEKFNRNTLVCDKKYECNAQPGCSNLE